MSKEAMEAVVGKAVLDSEFRQVLFANPEEALAGYELTEQEIAALKSFDAETIDSFADTLDEHISKVVVASGGGLPYWKKLRPEGVGPGG
jgi:hypothetical protein